ncbi:serine/threonine-protein kinase [Nocardiopsis lambiniae]|uniref:non-specific serine/threonine protein kinase n=1 Tax=Nocardiopsis lambiniae TaxID=3075539 RepID=A0ABU2M355_9ACTN|nr:serine/threonine-protein kinase [Nocardiopsis sp. DSM 44743]MDT0327083.1 serine/threonine-protein kinase [Nocardiopsis sp. DSM 44743]
MNSSEADSGRLLANRYRLDEVIGAGGMGRVWQGVDTLLDRPVAVKELTSPPNLPAHEVEVLRTRMLREARSAAQLSHPSIITVFDVAEEDGRPWIVMELVPGSSLGDLIRDEGAQPVGRVADIGEQMAAGLSEAHGRGIVHRDVKPGNVLINARGRTVLTDFGIAHLDGATHLTSTGLLIGSPSYLAPEIAHGHSATPASDVWSLGITLFQALEGTLPFDRPTPMATLTAIVTQELPAPVNAGPLAPLLRELCAKKPEDRPHIDTVRARLREIRDRAETVESAAPVTPTLTTTAPAEEPVVETAMAAEAPPPEQTGPTAPRPARAERERGNRRTLLLVAAVLVVLVVAAGATLMVSMNRDGAPDAGLASEQQAGAAPDEEESAPPVSEEASEEAEAEESTSEDADEEPEEDEADPWEGELEVHEDSSGFTVEYPDGWTYERDGHMVYFRNPDGGYLLVDQTDSPGPDAAEDWRDFEPRARGNFPGYERTGIEEVEGGWADSYLTAADWEFTFDGRNGRMHAINRGFHTEAKGYALFLVASDEHPDLNRQLLDRLSETFVPAA